MKSQIKQLRIHVFLTLCLAFCISLHLSIDSQAARKKQFITNNNFQGTYSYDGLKGSYSTGGYEIIIGKITSNGKVKFRLERWSAYYEKAARSNIITAKINGNKVSFKFKDRYRNSSGKGSLVFTKDKNLYLEVEATNKGKNKNDSYNLGMPKSKFIKINNNSNLK